MPKCIPGKTHQIPHFSFFPNCLLVRIGLSPIKKYIYYFRAFILSFVTSLLSWQLSTTVLALCPQSWELFGGQCYWVSKSTGTWMEGKKDCESRGSHLAVFRNTTEMVSAEWRRLEKDRKVLGFGG
uniref:C-type lectin domain-containing protein n=1 Tax=Anas platyrhynchos platyrhynchos TaxID=8840 RepID=A0A493U322_ANAPP